MFRPAPLHSHRPLSYIDASRESHLCDDDDDNNDNDNDHDSKPGHRIVLLEQAFKRRAEELTNLQQAFTESLEGKRPLDPPTQFGTAVQRAWLHSADAHDYRDQLELQIDRAEALLEKLEEKL